ncbi:hypothetical protein D3C72_1817460 [compost metagenome]
MLEALVINSVGLASSSALRKDNLPAVVGEIAPDLGACPGLREQVRPVSLTGRAMVEYEGGEGT